MNNLQTASKERTTGPLPVSVADSYTVTALKLLALLAGLTVFAYGISLDIKRQHLAADIAWCEDYEGDLVTMPDGKRECLNNTYGRPYSWISVNAAGVASSGVFEYPKRVRAASAVQP